MKNAVLLDTETTGLSPDRAQVIELALLPFSFNEDDFEIHSVQEAWSALQDPGIRIPLAIQRITGISNDLVQGQSIDWNFANSILTRADYILAHNASFDRGFIDRLSSISTKKIWICTASQLKWRSYGFRTGRLEELCRSLGIEHDAHRAKGDVLGLMKVLQTRDAQSSRTYFSELMSQATQPAVFVQVEGKTYDHREELKRFRFQWDQQKKVWGRWLLKSLLDERLELWTSAFPGTTLKIVELPLEDRFKSPSENHGIN